MNKIVLWHALGDDPPRRHPLDRPVWVTSEALTPAADQPAEDGHDGVLIVPTPAERFACCGLLVPERVGRAASRNRGPLAPGLHRLRHEDRIEIGKQTVWVAESRLAEPTTYSPDVHGEDLFCARTKARLHAQDDQVVACPGCGVLFSQRAWDLLIPCHLCGHDPNQDEWQPPRGRRPTDGVKQLLALVGASGGGD